MDWRKIVVVVLIASLWVFGSFLPKRAADNFLKDLGQQEGFKKLIETRTHEVTRDNLNIVAVVNQALDKWMDEAMGYKLYENYSTKDELVQKYDEVEIYSLEGDLIASGIYEGLWSSNLAYLENEFHIITVRAPQKKGKYSALFKIATKSVDLKKK